MAHSPAAATITSTTATPQEPKPPMSQAGLTPSDGRTLSSYQPPRRPRPDEAPRIISKLSTIGLWQINPTDTSATAEAIKLLKWALVPATYDEASYWLTRLLAHFPRVATSKAAVMISDICADCVQKQHSLAAIFDAYDAIWKNATSENPWPPTSGDLVRLIQANMDRYRAHLDRLDPPTPKPPQETPSLPEPPSVTWDTLSIDERIELARKIATAVPALQTAFLAAYDVPKDFDFTGFLELHKST